MARRVTGAFGADGGAGTVTRGLTAAATPVEQQERCPSARVVAFIPTGMLDWPGKIASTLFLSGCPLRCPYCHNPDLLTARYDPGCWRGLLSHLSIRRGWIDGVVITGGEPTAAPDLIDLLEALASRGIPVKLDTNGTSPGLLNRILEEGLVSFVALDLKTVPERYGEIGPSGAGDAVLASIGVIRRTGVAHEFRTTVYPPLVRQEDLPRIARLIRGGDRYVLQQFRPGHTLDPAAGEVRPYDPERLAMSAAMCSTYLPTITRGV